MHGWKTTTGAIVGIAGVVLHELAPLYPALGPWGVVVAALGAGLSAIGIGHKQDKTADAVRATKKSK